MKNVFLFIFFMLGLAQLHAQQAISEDERLGDRCILILPTADSTKLSAIKTEFAKHPQIARAIYVYQNHHALLIEFADMLNPEFVFYSDIIKMAAFGVKYEEIAIKDPSAYSQIFADKDADNSTFIVK